MNAEKDQTSDESEDEKSESSSKISKLALQKSIQQTIEERQRRSTFQVRKVQQVPQNTIIFVKFTTAPVSSKDYQTKFFSAHFDTNETIQDLIDELTLNIDLIQQQKCQKWKLFFNGQDLLTMPSSTKLSEAKLFPRAMLIIVWDS